MHIEGLKQEAAGQQGLKRRFDELARTWKAQRGPMVCLDRVFIHPAYQAIIGMGLPAVPLLLAELGREPDHWFWALKAITNTDPVRDDHRGRVKLMALDWLKWGERHGLA